MFGCELGTPDAGEINGREPLGMTAKNGAPGGSFCCGRREGGEGCKMRCGGLSGAFWRMLCVWLAASFC